VREIQRNRIFDNSFKYAVNVGPFRGAVEAQFRSGAFSAPGNAVEAQIGADYAGLSVDAIFSHVTDAITLSSAPGGDGAPGVTYKSGETDLVAGTVSDNTSVMLLAKYTYGPVRILYRLCSTWTSQTRTTHWRLAVLSQAAIRSVRLITHFATDKILQSILGWREVRSQV